MEKPPFEKVTAGKFDEFLRKFFVDYLEYECIDKDPDAKDPKSIESWRMVVPVDKARPFAVAYEANLSSMEVDKLRKLYIDRVIPHRDGFSSVQPSLYIFTDGARMVFFSADPARNRDVRFDLSNETWQFEGF